MVDEELLRHSWRAKADERAILGEGCKVCEYEYMSVYPSLVFRYYAAQQNLKAVYDKDSTLGMQESGVFVNMEQSARIKNAVKEGLFNEQWMIEILRYKKVTIRKVVFNQIRLDSYFESNMSNEDYVKGNASIEQMMEEDGGEKEVFKGADNLDTDIFDLLDVDTEKLFDAFFARLTDIEKFFVLLEVHCCDEKYTRMTAGELAADDILVSIVAEDPKLKKNISTGDIRIERPGRSSASGMTAIEMKNVEIVSDNLIRYQRRKAVSTLNTLRVGLKVADVTGTCSVNYFRKQWDRLPEKYL